jgi:hypothetical protein
MACWVFGNRRVDGWLWVDRGIGGFAFRSQNEGKLFPLPVRAAVLSGRAAANELIPATVNDDGNERGQKIVC